MGKLERFIVTSLLVLFLVSIISTTATASQADFNKGYNEGCSQGYSNGFIDHQAGSNFCTTQAFQNEPKVINYDTGYTKGYGDCYPNGYEADSEYSGK